MKQTSISPITVRPVKIEFSEEVNRYWLGNSPFKTHLFNSFTLLIPDIEKYIIQSIKRQLPEIKQPLLKQSAKAFIGQEVQHSLQHTKFWDNLYQQGYEIEGYLRFLQNLLKFLGSRFSLSLNLAIIAGLEHLTTLMAEFVLEKELLAEADPQLKALFEWHALEEIEHKSVAYDVLQTATKSYPLRLAGLVVSHILVLGLLKLGLAVLLFQDQKLLNRKVWQEIFEFWLFKEKFLFKVLWNIGDYTKKDFHPSQCHNLFLTEKP